MAQPMIRPIAGPRAMPAVQTQHMRRVVRKHAKYHGTLLPPLILAGSQYSIALHASRQHYFQASVSGSKERLSVGVSVWGGSKGMLYVKYGGLPTPFDWNDYCHTAGDGWSAISGVGFSNPATGYWYILVQGLVAGQACLSVSYQKRAVLRALTVRHG